MIFQQHAAAIGMNRNGQHSLMTKVAEPIDAETQAKREARKQKDEARRLTICVQNI